MNKIIAVIGLFIYIFGTLGVVLFVCIKSFWLLALYAAFMALMAYPTAEKYYKELTLSVKDKDGENKVSE